MKSTAIAALIVVTFLSTAAFAGTIHGKISGVKGQSVVYVEATPNGWKEDGRFSLPHESKIRLPSGRFWTHPVVANGCLYLRDQGVIFCYDVRAAK